MQGKGISEKCAFFHLHRSFSVIYTGSGRESTALATANGTGWHKQIQAPPRARGPLRVDLSETEVSNETLFQTHQTESGDRHNRADLSFQTRDPSPYRGPWSRYPHRGNHSQLLAFRFVAAHHRPAALHLRHRDLRRGKAPGPPVLVRQIPERRLKCERRHHRVHRHSPAHAVANHDRSARPDHHRNPGTDQHSRRQQAGGPGIKIRRSHGNGRRRDKRQGTC